jgi:hypothetical protein
MNGVETPSDEALILAIRAAFPALDNKARQQLRVQLQLSASMSHGTVSLSAAPRERSSFWRLLLRRSCEVPRVVALTLFGVAVFTLGVVATATVPNALSGLRESGHPTVDGPSRSTIVAPSQANKPLSVIQAAHLCLGPGQSQTGTTIGAVAVAGYFQRGPMTDGRPAFEGLLVADRRVRLRAGAAPSGALKHKFVAISAPNRRWLTRQEAATLHSIRPGAYIELRGRLRCSGGMAILILTRTG